MDSNETTAELSLRESGGALLRQGKFAEAANLLTDAVEADPTDESAWRLLGGALASTGDYTRATPAFERAIALSPDNARNHYNVALAYQATQRAEEATSAAARSVALDPNYPQAQQLLRSLGGTVPAPAPPRPTAPPASPIVPPPLAPTAPPSLPLAPPSLQPAALPTAAAHPTPVAAASTPAPAPMGMPGLGSIGGGMPGLGSIGGGGAPAPTPEPAPPVAAAPAGLGSVGGPALRPATPVAQPGAYAPPEAYTPPGTYTPPTPVMVGGVYAGNSVTNTSGLQGDVPPEAAAGFNLGAAVITFWWLRNHNLRQISWGLAGVYFLMRMAARLTGASAIYLVLLLVQGVMFFVLGFMGNRLAWQNRAFNDIDDFKSCQRIWMYWAIPLLCVQIVFFILIFVLAARVRTLPGVPH